MFFMKLKRFVILMAMAFLSLPMFAQMKVTGVVVSADDGEPIIGATVRVKGQEATGTATDFDGRFTLTVRATRSSWSLTLVWIPRK